MFRALIAFLLLSTTLAHAVDEKRIQKAFEDTAARFPGRTGMVFLDLKTMRKVTRNPNGVFESASIVKVPILLEVYLQAGEGRLSLDERLTLREGHKTSGSGILKDRQAGTRYTIRQLADWMVTISDNTATNMLVERIGMDSVNRRLQVLGFSKTRLRRNIMDFGQIDLGLDNLTTPAETASLFKILYQDPKAAPVVKVLEGQKRRHMIPAGLPKGTRAATKTGELSGVVNDAGIVWTPRGAYVLALLSLEAHDAPAAYQAWSRLSREVYRACMEGR